MRAQIDANGLSFLLDLDGEIQEQGNGFWISIRVWRVTASMQMPNGIRYSLTLHDPYGQRLMGFDNAHATKPIGSKFKYCGQHIPYDHQHRHALDEGIPYHFQSAYQLLADFYNEVDRVISEVSP